MIKKISLTGGIGSGKSTVMKLLKELGYCVWDADIFATEAMAIPSVSFKIKELFGEKAYDSKNYIDRKFIREKVFADESLRLKLEQILHPEIQALFKKRIEILEFNQVSSWVFYEASLIFEKNIQNRFDVNVLITAEDDIRLERLSKSRSLSHTMILKIMAQQMPTVEKEKLADWILDNSGSEEALSLKTNELIQFLKQKFQDL